jgi:hypothetical protein
MDVGPRYSTAHTNENFLVENFSFQNLLFLNKSQFIAMLPLTNLLICHVAINQSINFTVRGS